MTIPLDRLYYYIESIAQDVRRDNVIIYRFFPHGSKKIEDLKQLTTLPMVEFYTQPHIYCNDQEPLDWARYVDHRHLAQPYFKDLFTKYNLDIPDYNIRTARYAIFDRSIILHSEQRSTNLELYEQNGFVPVYYWSHAIIALDWYRYAQYDIFKKKSNKTFLIYNRAWSGTREYRLKFLDLLIDRNLESKCQTTCNPLDPELQVHYTQHEYKDICWAPTHVLENYFNPTKADSSASADYSTEDYCNTDIEVVLETLFDDERLHLTEKALRPIACGQPFILAATHGSLEYLRRYGFKTYGHIWSESYDKETDPKKRLIAIANVMQEISNWDNVTKAYKMKQAEVIAEYNRNHFFSNEFVDIVVDELKNNFNTAFKELEVTNTSEQFINHRKQLSQYPEFKNFFLTSEPRPDLLEIMRRARKYYVRTLPKQILEFEH